MKEEHTYSEADPLASWIGIDAIHFVNNLYLSVRPDEPLDLCMRRVFTEITAKLTLYAHGTTGLHLLVNTLSAPDRTTLELHHLLVDDSAEEFLSCAIDQRQPQPPKDSFTCDIGRPEYIQSQRTERTETRSPMGLNATIHDLLPNGHSYFPLISDRDHRWDGLFAVLNKERQTKKLPPIACDTARMLLIPLSEPDDKMPSGNLGTVIVWSTTNLEIEQFWKRRLEQLMCAAKVIGSFLSRFLKTHYGTTDATFLPSYRLSGPKSVGIMFADIRDFTPTMEIARNFQLTGEMHSFMREYCEQMGRIIIAKGGRVSGYSGDGVMALFGEYNLTPKEMMHAAVNAGKEMCISFEKLKLRVLSSNRIRQFFEQAVEPLDFRLGIGINYGEVIFDYFGAEGNRTFSVLGDHVNFAQRLESQAGRYDDRLSRQRAPILLSRPAWLAGGFVLRPDDDAIPLQVKGKSYDYPAYEIWPTA